ncbi:MAG: SDR family oxidoreductase [Bacteroidota bacterium]
MEISLKDKIILLTGGSRGIGAAIAHKLAEAGAELAIQYGRSRAAAEQLAAELKTTVHLFQCDFTDASAVHHLADNVYDQLGRIDVLVNNAGVALAESDDLSWEDWQMLWEQSLQVNLVATAALSRSCVKKMRGQGSGRLIHISSRAAFRGDTAEYLAYASSKAGMVALSRSLARAYGKDGIKSFVIAPGFVETDMAQQFIEEYGREYVLDDLALGELTQAADIAPTVLFLASGWMDHATGCSIDINAGSYVH